MVRAVVALFVFIILPVLLVALATLFTVGVLGNFVDI
jgi:hypothetical protein